MQRIIIIGTSGSGKTTLGRELSNIKKLPFYDLDEYLWLPGWQKRNEIEFKQIVANLTANECWVISGNYPRLRDWLWGRADTIIWLDYSFMRCFWQCLLRTLKRMIFKIPCCNENFENVCRTIFSRHSILWWVCKSYWKYKKEYGHIFNCESYKSKSMLRFSEPAKTKNWLKFIRKC